MIASPSIQLYPLKVGHCRHLEWCSDRGGRLATVCFPAHCALIRHPSRGWILFDTGYSQEFFAATDPFPERLYRWMLPVTLQDNERLEVQLAARGIQVTDIETCVISHFHADHIAGLKLFKNARYIASRESIERSRQLREKRWRAVLEGYLASLLPSNFDHFVQEAESSSRIDLPSWMAPFSDGFDLFGDQSLIGVLLPGHSIGQLGLLLPNVDGRAIFLAADACWSAPACLARRLPGWPGLLISASKENFLNTFLSLSALMEREPSLLVLPSHCRHSWSELSGNR